MQKQHKETRRTYASQILDLFFLITLTIINYVDRVVLSISSSQITSEFGLSPVTLGYLFSSFLWLYFIALIPMGLLVDRYGPGHVGGWGAGIFSLATILTALTGGFASLLACRLMMGVGESTTYPAGGRAIKDWAPESERGIATAIFHAGSMLGPALGAVTLGWVVNEFGWRMAFALTGAIGFVWLILWAVWYRHPDKARWLSSPEKSLIRGAASGVTESSYSESERLGLRKLLRSPSLWAITFAHGCAVYTTYLFLTWLPGYLQLTKGMNVTRSGIFTALPYFGAALLGIAIGIAGDRYLRTRPIARGYRRNVVALCLLMSAFILLVPFTDSLPLIVILLTISLTGCTAAVASNLSLVNDLLPSGKDAGTAVALISTGGNLFGLMAPIVTGYVIASTKSFNTGFIIAGALAVSGALATLILTHKPIGNIRKERKYVSLTR